MEAETLCTLFRDNAALCNEVTERVVQHFVHCIETHGRHMQYLKFLQTIVKSENTYIRKCQDMVMSEVSHDAHMCTDPQRSPTNVFRWLECYFIAGMLFLYRLSGLNILP